MALDPNTRTLLINAVETAFKDAVEQSFRARMQRPVEDSNRTILDMKHLVDVYEAVRTRIEEIP